MTSEEAIYWKTYIDRVVAEKLSVLNNSQQDAVRIRQFADSFMQGINGQQLLPQSVFRQFIEMFAHIPAMEGQTQEMLREVYNELLKKIEDAGFMGETFITNMAVGGIESGTQIEATDAIKTLIKNILLKFKEAVVKSAPSATISPTGGDVEYGTTISNTFTANLADGKFTQYTNGGTSTQDISMGCNKTSTAFQKKVGNGSYTDYTNGTSFKVNETTAIKAIVSHSASTAKPTNSDGSSTLSYAAGSKEAIATYTPRLGWFFVTLDEMPESVTRETFGNYDGLVTGAFNTTQSFNKKVVLLAIPSEYKLSSALSANNEEQTYTESDITIADAGGTSRNYKLLAFEYASPLEVNVTLKIKA